MRATDRAEMQNFSFMKARLPDPEMSSDAIIKRLTLHRQAPVAAKKTGLKTTRADDEPDKQKWMNRHEDARMPATEHQVIKGGAELIVLAHRAGKAVPKCLARVPA